jgi:hypothetical protein
MRNQRDKTLAMPRLILPSVQVNINAGELPKPEDNGVRYLKIPLNQLSRPLHETAPLLEAYHQTEKKQRMAMK